MSVESLTALIRSGNAEELKRQLDEDPSWVARKTEQGISLLQLAVYCRNKKVIDVLRPLSSLDLFEAASTGELSIVQSALQKDAALLNAFAVDGFTALGLACFFDHYEIANFLLNEGANPDIASNNSFKVAPIHSACAISSVALTKLLLRHGASVNIKQTNDITPLHETAHNGNTELTRLLIEHGADINARTKDGLTPLAMALEKGFTETAELVRQSQ